MPPIKPKNVEVLPEPPFKLSPGEIASGAWGRLSEQIGKSLESLRTKLESSLPEAETAETRGRIRALRSILGYAEEERAPLEWVDANAPTQRLTKEDILNKFRN